MDLCNRNGNNKRKFSQSVERNNQSKRKTNQIIGCFRRYCMRKKHQIIPDENEEKISIRHLTRSPLFHETKFCQKVSKLNGDPCLEYCVQYGPDIWENIPNKRSDGLRNERVKEDDLSTEEKFTHERIDPVKDKVNSFINDGVDQISELSTTKSNSYHREKEDNFRRNELKKNSFDLMQSKQNQNSEFILEKTSQMNDYSSIHLSSNNPSSQTIPDSYNWNLLSNEINFDQQKVSDEINLSQDQEPYNWDYQEYQSSSPIDSSQKTQVVHKLTNNQSKQSDINDINAFLSTNDLTVRSNSIASVLSSNKRREAQSSSTDLKIPIPSFIILDQQQSSSNLFEGKNIRLDATSVNDLITHAKKQKSLGSYSSSTGHSTSVLDCPFGSSDVVTDNDDQKEVQSIRSIFSEKQLPTPPNTETKESKNVINTDTKNRARSIDRNTLYQIRSTYDDIMNFWEHLLERFLHFMLPSIQNTVEFSRSTITSNTHSWSTMIPSSTLDMGQSDNIGPWWSRRDVNDQTPATFIFANESLSASYSIEPITISQQMCISIENRPFYFNDYSYSDTCHCCCSSSSS